MPRVLGDEAFATISATGLVPGDIVMLGLWGHGRPGCLCG
jgi:hypothetical protein